MPSATSGGGILDRSHGPGGRRLGDRVTGHQGHQLLDRGIRAVDGRDGGSGPHHRDAIGDLEQPVHAVRDEDGAHASGAELPDDVEESVAGTEVECGGRLVEDQQIGLAHERPGDAARLLIAERERGHGGVEVEVSAAQAEEDLPRDPAPLPGGKREPEHAVDAEPDVLEHRLGGDDQHLLEHCRDGAVHGARRQFARPQVDLAGVGLLDEGEDLHQRALARAVLAQHGVHLAGAHREGGLDDGAGRSERLRDPRAGQHGGARPAHERSGITGSSRLEACSPPVWMMCSPKLRVSGCRGTCRRGSGRAGDLEACRTGLEKGA